jgi:catalase (peroxidase I)
MHRVLWPLSRCRYWGPWSFSPSTFSNAYFKNLLELEWKPKTTHKGKKWTGPQQCAGPSRGARHIRADARTHARAGARGQ